MNKFIENKTNSPMYVGSQMIPPGEGAMVQVPDEAAEPVALLLKDSVKAITASLDQLSDDTLAMMAALEGGADKPRTSLLTAISDEVIARADAALASDTL
jgi:hypothetical protein